MLIGPLPLYCVHRLQDLLKRHDAEHEVFVSANKLEKLRKHNNNGSWSFENWNYLYIEIATKDIMIVCRELNAMGISLYESSPDFLEPSGHRVIALSGTESAPNDTLIKFIDHIERVNREPHSEFRGPLIFVAVLLACLVVGFFALAVYWAVKK